MVATGNGRIIFEDESLRETRSALALKNGMCEAACMKATEKPCTCYCGGALHGISNPAYQAQKAAYDTKLDSLFKGLASTNVQISGVGIGSPPSLVSGEGLTKIFEGTAEEYNRWHLEHQKAFWAAKRARKGTKN